MVGSSGLVKSGIMESSSAAVAWFWRSRNAVYCVAAGDVVVGLLMSSLVVSKNWVSVDSEAGGGWKQT